MLCAYDYAIVRVVPRVERGEFINAGAIVSCQRLAFLEARIELDESRVRALDADADLETLQLNLESIVRICEGGPLAGPIGSLSQRERFHWLVAPRSTIIQLSPVHSGRCGDPRDVLQHLLDAMVKAPTSLK